MRSISRNTRPPERRPHGLTLDDVRGSICKPVSYWAIDESGNPSRKPGEEGKAFTLSAVTELSPIDYDRLLDGVPLYDGEVHFSKLRNEHPDICIRLMTNFGNENILILSKTVIKKKRKLTPAKKKGEPLDELYLFSLLNDIVEVISEIDMSDTIVITYDRIRTLREEMCPLLWTDRRIFLMGESEVYRLIQMADLSASSLGRVFLPGGYADSSYFREIEARSVNIQDGRNESRMEQVGSTQLPTSTPSRNNVNEVFEGSYFEDGMPVKTEKGLAGCTQHPAFAPWVSDSGSDYKEPHRRGPFRSKCAKKRCIQCN